MEEQNENETKNEEQNQEDDNQKEKENIIDIENQNNLSSQKEKNENQNDISLEKKEEENNKIEINENDNIDEQNKNIEKTEEMYIEENKEEKKENAIDEQKENDINEKKEENLEDKNEEKKVEEGKEGEEAQNKEPALNSEEKNKEENKNNENKNEFNYDTNNKRRNRIQFSVRNRDGINNRYQDYFNTNRNISNYNYHLSFEPNPNEKKFQELKVKYLSPSQNKFFSSFNENYVSRCNLFSPREIPNMGFTQSLKIPNKNINYIDYRYYYKPVVCCRNIKDVMTEKRREDIMKLMNSNSNNTFENIMKKLNKKNDIEESKVRYNPVNRNGLLYSYNSGLRSYKNYGSEDKKNAKLKHLIKEVFDEIQYDCYISPNKNKNILSNLKSKIKFSNSLSKYRNYEKEKLIRQQYNSPYKNNKYKNLNYNDLLRLCTKDNLTKYSQSAKKGSFLI